MRAKANSFANLWEVIPTHSHLCLTVSNLVPATYQRGRDHRTETFPVAPEIVISRWPQKERDLVLVDTPGFEDTNRTSDKVLRLVSEKFADLYRCGISINASIYLHPMTEARMQPGSIMNLSTFKSLVGEAKWRSVILLTTRWDTVEKADGVKKENELRNTKQFWGDLVDGGATIMQHNRRDRMSARNVLDKTVEFATPTPLQVQEEIVSQGLPSDRTEATFSFMFYNNHQQLLDDIEAEFKMVGTAAESLQVHRKDSLYWGNNMALLQQTLYDFANSEWLKKATITAAILIATAEIQNRYPEIGKMLSSSRVSVSKSSSIYMEILRLFNLILQK